MAEDQTGTVLRTVVIPDFTSEQTAYLDDRMAAARGGADRRIFLGRPPIYKDHER